MSKNVERAKELVPAIILTILSMIQALAIELFWSKIESSELLWAVSLEAAIVWLQLAVVLLGILLVWVFYVSFVLRFSWLPTLEDTLVPFLIGLLEFALIDLMFPSPIGPWFLLLAAVYGLTTATTHMMMRRARQDPANDYFFSQKSPATWGDYLVSAAVVGALTTIGAVLWIIDEDKRLAVAALLVALLALVHQFRQAHRYWMHSLVLETADSSADEGADS